MWRESAECNILRCGGFSKFLQPCWRYRGVAESWKPSYGKHSRTLTVPWARNTQTRWEAWNSNPKIVKIAGLYPSKCPILNIQFYQDSVRYTVLILLRGTAPCQLDKKLGCVVHRRLDIRAESFGDLIPSALTLYYARHEKSVHTWGLTPRILSFIAISYC